MQHSSFNIHFRPIGHLNQCTMHHIWALQIQSSGVSLKRSYKMQFRRVVLRSIGPQVKSYDQIKFLADFPIVITMQNFRWVATDRFLAYKFEIGHAAPKERACRRLRSKSKKKLVQPFAECQMICQQKSNRKKCVNLRQSCCSLLIIFH